jgi:type VI secretion system protein ImpG
VSDKYFQSEYLYLVEQGRAFAERFPDLGRELNLADASGRDPNVERLLEGFAFLTGRIRQRLDDDFPQLVRSLLEQLWPHHGRPVPSFCLMEFAPRPGQLDQAVEVPRGSEVESQTLAEGLRCRYRTTSPLWVTPLSVHDAKGESLGTVCRLDLGLRVPQDTDTESLAERPLRIHLYGEFSNCIQIYNLLMGLEGERRHLSRVKLTARAGQREVDWTLPPESLSPLGMSRDDTLLPEPDNALWSFSLLQEYFLFKDKYLGFELHLPKGLGGLEDLREIQLRLEINHQWPSGLQVSTSNFRLNCVPAVNLFKRDAEPVRVDQLHDSYRVLPDLRHLDLYEVFSVDQVEGISLADGSRRVFQPLFTARNPLGQDQPNALEGPFYVTKHQARMQGRPEVYISLVDPMHQGGFPREATLSLTLTASNGRHGSRPLAGQISEKVSQVPDSLLPRNLNQPTRAFHPDQDADPLWTWLGFASLNYLNLDSAPRLQGLLMRMLPRSNEADLRRIQGVQEAKLSRVRERIRGTLLGGNRLEVRLQEEHFAGPGDVQLFCRVLGEFLGTYASLNSFFRLAATTSPSGKQMLLSRRFGDYDQSGESAA